MTSSPSWVYSDRSELIYEDQNSGVVFWIVGDQRDGIDSDALRTIANSLSLVDVNRSNPYGWPCKSSCSEYEWGFVVILR
ncbi:MAG TPA: hypothetical protein VN207_05025 [Ktedonobacteraceae bacterium]|nr:hypothetical protein [Ktedonobacteraceae bacterium]